jgi:hypothetical protein
MDLARPGADAELAAQAGLKEVTHLYFTCYSSCKAELVCFRDVSWQGHFQTC